ncbi:tRNA N6-adenosine threonylcarbamoyltransferase, mitochondrial-like [Oopsacas minuta]|uniref:N(6)-L-threonylcarbamoyladenine synthase n=1 Tax=Oopsacas minuta TaxID=111878 RepID=A0AAV7K100_9METZ|nr:tRNA N6-adenosine threonylcarbamoyltransferase, mitochondrial-like [Oopsacas minuta]
MKTLRHLSYLTNTLPARFNVLGIESSFDDSAVGILDSHGNIYAHVECSQLLHHLPTGGVNPVIASGLHKQNLPPLLDQCFDRSGLTPKDIHVVAYTKGPGLGVSLLHGANLAVNFFRENLSPPRLLIGIHHMLAHALVPRISNRIAFPYLTLLASGGHCLLCIVQELGISEVIRLGSTLDTAPGNVLDHGARLLQLSRYPEFSECSGGQAIERISLRGTLRHPVLNILPRDRNANFSFSGLGSSLEYKLNSIAKQRIVSYQDKADLALWFQTSLIRHITTKTQNGIRFCRIHFPQINSLVVSGGVAQNLAFQKAVTELCRQHNYTAVYPALELCTDNAVMIAWAGVEYANAGIGIESPEDEVHFIPRWKLGEDWTMKLTQN